ncbi:MAG: hypothetical protein ACLRQR_13495 [Merdimonas faecis]
MSQRDTMEIRKELLNDELVDDSTLAALDTHVVKKQPVFRRQRRKRGG